MPSDDTWTNASGPLEEKASSKQGRPLTRGMRSLIYELFVLGELMVQPMTAPRSDFQRWFGPQYPRDAQRDS
jgi:hypothetical protein